MKYSILIRLTVAILMVPAIFSCQSSYKVTKDSYVFKKQTYRPVEKSADPIVLEEELAEETQVMNTEPTLSSAQVSTEKTALSETTDQRIRRTKKAPGFVQDLAEGSKSREEAVAEYKNLSRKEKKEVKRWVKKEVKAYKKEVKNVDETEAVTRDMRTGIILGAAGLVLLLIAGGGVLGAIGAILFVVGLVFILLEVL